MLVSAKNTLSKFAVVIAIAWILGAALTTIIHVLNFLSPNVQSNTNIVEDQRQSAENQRPVQYFMMNEASDLTAIFVVEGNSDPSQSYGQIKQSLQNFAEHNRYPVKAVHVVVNGMLDRELGVLLLSFPQVRIMTVGQRVLPIKLWDFVIPRLVDTPFYLIGEGYGSSNSVDQIGSTISGLKEDQKSLDLSSLSIDKEQLDSNKKSKQVLSVYRLEDYMLLEGGYSGVLDIKQQMKSPSNFQKLTEFYTQKGFHLNENKQID